MPVIEAQLCRASGMLSASQLSAESERRPRGRDPRDQIEELEDANDKLTRATDRVERRLAELERQIATTDERTERSVGVARREMMSFLEQNVQETNQKVAALKEDDAAILEKLEVVRRWKICEGMQYVAGSIAARCSRRMRSTTRRS